VPQRQTCPAAPQPQPGPQRQAWPATAAAVGGVTLAWQPQRQPAPGQSTHWHEGFEGVFMEISCEGVYGSVRSGSVARILVMGAVFDLNETADFIDCRPGTVDPPHPGHETTADHLG
jgi:hypothetical protein